MSERDSGFGPCPSCQSTTAGAPVLIEYEGTDGSRAMFIECGECRAVLHHE